MRKYIPLFLLTLPFTAAAQGQDAWSLWGYLLSLIINVTKFFWLLTILAFLWGLVRFMGKADDQKARADAKKMMIGSIIAFTLAVSFWGLVTFAIRAFTLTPDRQNIPPTTFSN